MSRRILSLLALSLGLAPASVLHAQDTLLAGFTFSQFIGEGYPAISGETGDPVDRIVATYRGNLEPDYEVVDGVYVVNNGLPGYDDDSIGSWSFANFDTSDAVSVRADTFGGVNFLNATTVNGINMGLTDQAGMMLTFNTPGTLWNISVKRTTGYVNAADADFTFIARGNGGTAIVEWIYNGSVFATSTIPAGNFSVYEYELPGGFYVDGLISGRLVSGSVSFDNVHFNGKRGTPPVFTQQPADRTVTAGADVSFTVTVTGATSPTYRWYLNGSPLSNGSGVAGATTRTLFLSAVTLASAGSYTVVVDNNGVTAESDPAVLTVQTVPAFVIQPAPNAANPGQTVSFEVQVSGTPAPALQWEKDGVPLSDGPGISGATEATLTLTGVDVSSGGDYRVVAVNVVGTTPSDVATLTITVDVVAPAIATPPAIAVVNVGQTATFQVTATGAPAPTYQWRYLGGDLTDGAEISGATTRTLTLTNVSAGRAGDYTVVVTNSAGSVEATATLVVQTAPVIGVGSQPASRTVTAGNPVTFSVGATGIPDPSFQWRKNGLPIDGATGSSYTIDKVSLADDADYTVVVSNVAGSVESAVAKLTVQTLPKITSSPAGLTASKGSTVLLSVQATGTPDPVYQWYKDGKAISRATDSSYSITAISAVHAGSYSVRVQNAAGAVTSKTAIVRVSQPVAITAPTTVQVFTPGSTLSIGQPVASPGSVKYRWFLNGKQIAGKTSPFLVIEKARASDSGTYMIKLYNSQGKVVATRTMARVEIGVAGIYDALLRDPVSDEPVGRLEVKVEADGRCSGRLRFEDGGDYAYKGDFDLGSYEAAGSDVIVIKRVTGKSSLELDLVYDAAKRTLGAGLSVKGDSDLLGIADASLRAASAKAKGSYTLSFKPIGPVPAGQPTKAFTATATIGADGVMRLQGKTGDGAAFDVKIPAGTDLTYAVFIQPYGKAAGHIAGRIKLVKQGSVYTATLASGGEFHWFRPANTGPYRKGIDLTLSPTLKRR